MPGQNKAAAELQSLVSASDNAQQAARNVQSIQNTRDPLANIPAGGDADFALPEALASTVVGSFLFGPVGGILLGVAQGILGKEAEQNALDRFAAENEVMAGVNDSLNAEFERMAARATNPDDIAQLDAMQTQKDAALKMMTSASPRMQEKGAELLSGVYGEMTEYTERQETQRIENEAYDAELKRALDQEQYDRFNGIKIRFDDDSTQYESIMGSANIAIEALQNGSPTDLMAAAILVNKALDPTSVVRPEEAKAIGQMGNLADKFYTIVESNVGTGQSILPEQRNELIDLLGTIQGGANKIQLAREARYMTELNDAGVPTRYWDNFKLVNSVPAVAPKRVEVPASTGETAADAVTVPVTDAIEDTAEFFSPAGAEKRRIEYQDKILQDPGLFQPGGFFGRELTEEEQQRKKAGRRPTN